MGSRESQKSRNIFVHMTDPFMRVVARSRWWWLFQ
jgi:hypothetical protein